MKKLLWLIQAIILYILTMPIALMPLKISLWFGNIIGEIGFYFWKSRREIALENVEKVISAGFLPKTTNPIKLVKKNFQNLGKSLVEIIKIYHGKGKKIFTNVKIEGFEYFQNIEKKDKGVMFITGHCGNWELLALAISYRITPAKIVARKINNPYINKFVENLRKKYGNSVIYKEGALREIFITLKKGESVGMLIDQSVIPSEGIQIDFLGIPAWCMKVPVLIAKKTNIPLVPIFIKRDKYGHTIELFPEIHFSKTSNNNLQMDVKKINSYIEQYIIKNPTEWLWIHRKWKKRTTAPS